MEIDYARMNFICYNTKLIPKKQALKSKSETESDSEISDDSGLPKNYIQRALQYHHISHLEDSDDSDDSDDSGIT